MQLDCLFVQSFRAPDHVTAMLEVQIRQKVDKFELEYLSIDIDEKRFVVVFYFYTQLTTFLMAMFIYPDLNTIYLHFFIIFFSFSHIYF